MNNCFPFKNDKNKKKNDNDNDNKSNRNFLLQPSIQIITTILMDYHQTNQMNLKKHNIIQFTSYVNISTNWIHQLNSL